MSFVVCVFIALIKVLLMLLMATSLSDRIPGSLEQQQNTINIGDVSRKVDFSSVEVCQKRSMQQLRQDVIFQKQVNISLHSGHQLLKRSKKQNNTTKRRKKIKTLRYLIEEAELRYNIPKNLLLSIAKVETGVRPYAVNYNGRGYFFDNIFNAVSFAQNLLQRGQTNFSVGCFQLHYPSHRRKFKSIYDMFNPEKNVAYAALLLNNLYRINERNWELAVKRYHSGFELSNIIYYRKIISKLGRSI